MSEKVAIIGSGLVGKSWAMIFASAGYKVTLFDIEEAQVQKALENIAVELDQFEKDGVLRGQLSAEAQKKLISGSSKLDDCIKVILIKEKKDQMFDSAMQDAIYVQECVPENLDLKIKVWTQVDALITNSKTILASSSSCIIPSKISGNMAHQGQFIIAHPVNPPYHAPM